MNQFYYQKNEQVLLKNTQQTKTKKTTISIATLLDFSFKYAT
jgi:hypothetical protein